MRIQYRGDVYVSGREAAKHFKVSSPWFEKIYAPHLKRYPIPGYQREYFKEADLAEYTGPRPAESKEEK